MTEIMINKFCSLSSILIISPEPWDGHFVSKHHYAVTLAETGSHVYFLNPPDSSLSNIEVKNTHYKNLWQVKAPQIAKGLRFYPGFLRRRLEQKWLERLEVEINSRFTCIWLFENSRFYDMGFTNQHLKIYHQVDSNQNFHIPDAASSADICFCTTDFIKKELQVFNDRVYKIHHGVSELVQQNSLSNNQLEHLSLRDINVALVGNLDISFLDRELLKSLIELYPKVTFHLIGGYRKSGELFSMCSNFENIVWWDKVESSLIPLVLEQMDILLLLYKAEDQFELEQLASPHKVMEYLASGKVTVATYTDEYKDKSELLEMVDKNSDYISKFDDVINNLVQYNSLENQSKRKIFAKENTCSKQLNKVISYLKTHNLID